MELKQCLKCLKNARSDNEKMAALLLAAKLIKSDEIGTEGRKSVFETIGFSFINRLLATTNKIPEDCIENPYHQIAVTILACFCTDEDLVIHPQVTSKIPHFNNFILIKTCEGSSLAADSLDCLRAMSHSVAGMQHLMKHNSLEALTQAYLIQTKVSEGAKNTLLQIVNDSFMKDSDDYLESVQRVLSILAQEFRSNQDELKFKICDTIRSILIKIGSMLNHSKCDPAWLKEIGFGLKDIFSSKLDPQRKELALHLSAVISQLFGMNWALQPDPKFLLLWMHMTAMETRLAIEGKKLTEVGEKSSLLCSCFIALENTVVFLSEHMGCTSHGALDSEILLQIHMVLTEAFTSVLCLLGIASESGISARTKTFFQDYPIIMASIRVLGAWLAEETLAVATEVYNLLPFLLELCFISIPLEEGRGEEEEEEDKDILKFLLPGLCHMAADDKARCELLKNNFQKVMASYMHLLWPLSEHSSEKRGRLCLCCEVLENVCIGAPDSIKGDIGGSFDSIATLMLKVFTEKLNVDSTLIMNSVLLFLLIIRRRGQVTQGMQVIPVWSSLMSTLVDIMKNSPCVNPRPEATNWENVSELWFIAMQELSCLAKRHKCIKEAASKCQSIQQLNDILGRLIHQEQKDDEQLQSIQTSICNLLQVLK